MMAAVFFIKYLRSLGFDVNVSPNEDAVWLTKDDMARLFGASQVPVIQSFRGRQHYCCIKYTDVLQ